MGPIHHRTRVCQLPPDHQDDMEGQKEFLRVEDTSINFGGVQAIDHCSFEVRKGEIFALIGPNGAGKTTVLNLITGMYTPAMGAIYFEGKRISGKRPYQVAHLGIARTFQNIQVFQNMNVLENVMVGLHRKTRSGFTACLLRTPTVLREERLIRKKANEVAEFLGLSLRAGWPAASLPYGDQKRVEIARALALNPKLILLDEPVAGLNGNETEEMSKIILRIREMGITPILVEHDMNLVMGISDRIAVLNHGHKIAEGSPEAIRKNPKVIRAYLGEEF